MSLHGAALAQVDKGDDIPLPLGCNVVTVGLAMGCI